MEENWKDVPGYEGKYKVSDTGKVVGKRGFLLKGELTNGKYRRVLLLVDGKRERIFVHRLVAIAFIPNPQGFPVINHKDENSLNNCADNLEWCTHSYNINYGTRNQKISEKARSVRQIDIKGNEVAVFESASLAAKTLGYDPSNIYRVCRGEQKTAYGYVWKWI